MIRLNQRSPFKLFDFGRFLFLISGPAVPSCKRIRAMGCSGCQRHCCEATTLNPLCGTGRHAGIP